jgi:hypothetical protein
MNTSKPIGIILGAVALIVIILMFGLPRYNVWQQEMAGKAEMAKAEQNRKILIEEAKAVVAASLSYPCDELPSTLLPSSYFKLPSPITIPF